MVLQAFVFEGAISLQQIKVSIGGVQWSAHHLCYAADTVVSLHALTEVFKCRNL
jgi:hypothetical protein